MSFPSSPLVHAVAGSSNNNSVATSGVDTTGADLLVVIIHDYGASALGTLTDSKSNTWHALTSYQSGTVARCTIFWSKPTSVGSGHTFSFAGAASSFPSITMSAWSGAGSSPFDVGNGATTAGASTLATGSVTPSQVNALVIAGFTESSGTPSGINGGFTVTDSLGTSASREGGGHAYLVETSIVAANPTWTNGGSTDMAATIAVFIGGAITPLTVSATQGQAATLSTSRRLVKSLSATQGQSASLTRSKTFAKTLTATQGQAATLVRSQLPRITAVVPPSDRTTGGWTAYLVGSNFQNGATITIGGISATSVTWISSSKMSFVVPAGAAGVTTVVITNPDSSTTNAPFTYYALDANPTKLLTDFGGATPLILDGSVSGSQDSSRGSMNFEIVPAGTRPIPFTPAKFGIGSFADRDLLLRGEIETSKTVKKAETNVGWRGTIGDSTAQFNRNLVYENYIEQDAAFVAADLLSKYAPEFTGAHVASGLGNVSLSLSGVTLDTVFRTIASLIGGYYYRDESYDVHLFTSETPPLTPDAIDASNTSLIVGTFSLSADTKQTRNRVLGTGTGTQLLGDAAIGATSFPVQNALLFDNASNVVLVGTQRVTYSGRSTLTPSAPSTATSTFGNINNQVYYSYAYVIGGVETPRSAVTGYAGGNSISNYGGSATLTPSAGGNLAAGTYNYYIVYMGPGGVVTGGQNFTVGGITAGQKVTITAMTAWGSSGVYGSNVALAIYRTKVGGSTGSDPHFFVGTTPFDGTTTSFVDTLADTSLGIPTNSVSGINTNTTGLSATVTVANGPAGTTAKRIYRTHINAISTDPQYLAGTINNNTTTTLVDGATDSSLTQNAPIADSVGFLTGIPASGMGSITALLPAGSTVNLFAVRNDLTSQGLIAAIENASGNLNSTGVYEAKLTTSTTFSTQTALNAACDAQLALYGASTGVITANGSSYDSKIHYGRPIHINKDGLTADLIIQNVGISHVGFANAKSPIYTWTASSVRLTFEDVFRRLTQGAAE